MFTSQFGWIQFTMADSKNDSLSMSPLSSEREQASLRKLSERPARPPARLMKRSGVALLLCSQPKERWPAAQLLPNETFYWVSLR